MPKLHMNRNKCANQIPMEKNNNTFSAQCVCKYTKCYDVVCMRWKTTGVYDVLSWNDVFFEGECAGCDDNITMKQK